MTANVLNYLRESSIDIFCWNGCHQFTLDIDKSNISCISFFVGDLKIVSFTVRMSGLNEVALNEITSPAFSLL